MSDYRRRSIEKKPPHATSKKDTNPDPKISEDELPESDLNKVTGGMEPLKIVKLVDAASPKVYEH